MFEWLLAGFTGSLFSYLVVFETGACVQSCMAGTAFERTKKYLERLEDKIDRMAPRSYR
jgi:hypothetical protein